MERSFEEFVIRGFALPTSLKAVSNDLPKILSEVNPDVVIVIGLAPRATSIMLELVSANCLHFEIPDVNGEKVKLKNVGPHKLSIATTTLPIRRIVSRCSRVCRLRPSISIGTFICNAAAYKIYEIRI